jgi:EAL domain-containing protein (putative c-di-GMP-specific phosphodiesterase class I)
MDDFARHSLLQEILLGERPLESHAQSVIALRHGDSVAQEYLTRFLGPDGELHPLSLLVPEHLNAGMRTALDLACLEQTFGTLARQTTTRLLHFVNLDPHTLASPDFWARMPQWLKGIQIPTDQVVLEFTEGQSMHDLDALAGFARRLREYGLLIAVDDLGAGVASLTHMARLAPDFIKADRSLVHQVHRRPYQAALLNALSVFAQRMRIGFIAEGIETLDELQAVLDADVPWGQGYVFGRPGPVPVAPLMPLQAGLAGF